MDEFQDTNAVQWEIVRGLADIEQGGSLFVVGDPKQSIYQFRGADVSVFEQVKGQITELAVRMCRWRILSAHINHWSMDLIISSGRFWCAMRAIQRMIMRLSWADDGGEAARCAIGCRANRGVCIIDKSLTEEKLDSEAMRRWEAYELATRLKAIVEDEKRPVYDKSTTRYPSYKLW